MNEREDAIIRFVLGDMAEHEARRFARRLRVDAALREEARQVAEAWTAIGHANPEMPPARLRERVLDAAIEGTLPAPNRAQPRTSFRSLAAGTAAAAAAILLVVVGLDDLRLRREIAVMAEVSETLSQPNVVLSFSLAGEGPFQSAGGRASLDLDAKKAAIVVNGLPQLANGMGYRLWAIVGDEEVSCGHFLADDEERVVRQFAIPVRDYRDRVSGLFITIEAERATRPSGEIVMTSI
ncbi:MAG: anti-sigma factor [bacterium]|nr:anti-sigma factor [bacterium]